MGSGTALTGHLIPFPFILGDGSEQKEAEIFLFSSQMENEVLAESEGNLPVVNLDAARL